jgi:translation initiation factor 2 subunit 2
MSDDYTALLKRARSKVPENVGTGERFQMPVVDVQQEGKTTIVRNLEEILDKLNRTSDHLVPILLRELGTAGAYDGGRLVFQTKLGPDPIQARLVKYVETYVICGECGRPDTHLVKEDRTTVVKCDACGAHRPVKAGPKKQAIAMKAEEAVVEGKIYEVMCEDRGQRGDGIARRDRYTIFVKGGEKGKVYHVKIQKVTGTLAFADVVPAPQTGQQTQATSQATPPATGNQPAKK